jgi:hypothetical protein
VNFDASNFDALNFEAAEKIANAVLYEGYMLYPYRPSAIKNRQRWNFGTLYPPQFGEVRSGSERSAMHVECLLGGNTDGRLSVRGRFLRFNSGESGASDQAHESSLDCTLDARDPAPQTFRFPSSAGEIVASLRASVEQPANDFVKLRIDLANESQLDPAATRGAALPLSLVSAHLILRIESGEFVSLLDPPADFKAAVSDCRSEGCFPVLVGEGGQRNMLLCSPIILYDYPQIAPESAGDFFDGTEMDEMLTLRVITLTDEEKSEMSSADARTRALLERTEQTAREQLARTHGAIRSMRPVTGNE